MKKHETGHFLTCPICGGTGLEELDIPIEATRPIRYRREMVTCSFCDGLGLVFNIDCTVSDERKAAMADKLKPAKKGPLSGV